MTAGSSLASERAGAGGGGCGSMATAGGFTGATGASSATAAGALSRSGWRTNGDGVTTAPGIEGSTRSVGARACAGPASGGFTDSRGAAAGASVVGSRPSRESVLVSASAAEVDGIVEPADGTAADVDCDDVSSSAPTAGALGCASDTAARELLSRRAAKLPLLLLIRRAAMLPNIRPSTAAATSVPPARFRVSTPAY